ncbi:MAG: hypothetical protein Q9160_004457 [Pyrenula sp. 1 TL-2023]
METPTNTSVATNAPASLEAGTSSSSTSTMTVTSSSLSSASNTTWSSATLSALSSPETSTATSTFTQLPTSTSYTTDLSGTITRTMDSSKTSSASLASKSSSANLVTPPSIFRPLVIILKFLADLSWARNDDVAPTNTTPSADLIPDKSTTSSCTESTSLDAHFLPEHDTAVVSPMRPHHQDVITHDLWSLYDRDLHTTTSTATVTVDRFNKHGDAEIAPSSMINASSETTTETVTTTSSSAFTNTQASVTMPCGSFCLPGSLLSGFNATTQKRKFALFPSPAQSFAPASNSSKSRPPLLTLPSSITAFPSNVSWDPQYTVPTSPSPSPPTDTPPTSTVFLPPPMARHSNDAAHVHAAGIGLVGTHAQGGYGEGMMVSLGIVLGVMVLLF